MGINQAVQVIVGDKNKIVSFNRNKQMSKWSRTDTNVSSDSWQYIWKQDFLMNNLKIESYIALDLRQQESILRLIRLLR